MRGCLSLSLVAGLALGCGSGEPPIGTHADPDPADGAAMRARMGASSVDAAPMPVEAGTPSADASVAPPAELPPGQIACGDSY